jgi:hypothetical protein
MPFVALLIIAGCGERALACQDSSEQQSMEDEVGPSKRRRPREHDWHRDGHRRAYFVAYEVVRRLPVRSTTRESVRARLVVISPLIHPSKRRSLRSSSAVAFAT